MDGLNSTFACYKDTNKKQNAKQIKQKQRRWKAV
jgi:hypothetical protein